MIIYLFPESWGFDGMALFGLILARKGSEWTPETINHEKIHFRQQSEMLWITFFLWYGIEWLIRLIQTRDRFDAYWNLSFEREARQFADDLDYLTKRPFWAHLKFLTNEHP